MNNESIRSITREIYDVRDNTKYYPIPYYPKYLISKESEKILDNSTLEIVNHNNYMYRLENIYGKYETISFDRLLCDTMYGKNNFKINRKLKYSHCGSDLSIVPTEIEFDKSSERIYIDNIEFRNIINTPFYISKDGIVFNIKAGKFAKLDIRNGYYHLSQIRIYTNLTDKIHRLVYMVWVGPIDDGYTIDHLNGYKWCNSADKLESVTSIENSLRHNLNKYLNYNQTVTEFIHSIAHDIENDVPYSEISKSHNNFPIHSIKSIACRTSYSNLTLGYIFKNRHHIIDEEIAKTAIKLMNDGFNNVYISNAINIDIDTIRKLRRGSIFKNLPRNYHKNGYCFMSLNTINDIKQNIEDGISDAEIGRKYNISRKTVSSIRIGKTYNW